MAAGKRIERVDAGGTRCGILSGNRPRLIGSAIGLHKLVRQRSRGDLWDDWKRNRDRRRLILALLKRWRFRRRRSSTGWRRCKGFDKDTALEALGPVGQHFRTGCPLAFIHRRGGRIGRPAEESAKHDAADEKGAVALQFDCPLHNHAHHNHAHVARPARKMRMQRL